MSGSAAAISRGRLAHAEADLQDDGAAGYPVGPCVIGGRVREHLVEIVDVEAALSVDVEAPEGPQAAQRGSPARW